MRANVSDSGIHISGYDIDAELAASSASRIFLGKRAINPTQKVIIKLFYPLIIHDWQNEERFFREAEIFKRLQHPSILPLLEANLEKRIPYLVFAYAPHGSLHDWMQKRSSQSFSLDETLRLLAQIGGALQHAHQQQIVHGKIKPRNILFNSGGEALLADFTLPVLGAIPGGSIQNPDIDIYMAPEQFMKNCSSLSDQYALAYLAYTLLTEHLSPTPSYLAILSRPFRKAAHDVLYSPMQLSLDLPESIEQALLKALAPDAEQRYPDIRAFLEALGIMPNSPVIEGKAPSPTPGGTDPSAGSAIPTSSTGIGTAVETTSSICTPSTKAQASHKIWSGFIESLSAKVPCLPTTSDLPIVMQAKVNSRPGYEAKRTRMLPDKTKPQAEFHPRHNGQLLIAILVIIISILGSFSAALQPQEGLSNHEWRLYAYAARDSRAGTVGVFDSTVTVTPLMTVLSPTSTAEVSSQPPATTTADLGGNPSPTSHKPDITLTASGPGSRTTNVFTVRPAQFSPKNCTDTNNTYKCIAILTINNQVQGMTQWTIANSGTAARFIPATSGLLMVKQSAQIVITFPLSCPRAGAIMFSARRSTLTVPWNC